MRNAIRSGRPIVVVTPLKRFQRWFLSIRTLKSLDFYIRYFNCALLRRQWLFIRRVDESLSVKTPTERARTPCGMGYFARGRRARLVATRPACDFTP